MQKKTNIHIVAVKIQYKCCCLLLFRNTKTIILHTETVANTNSRMSMGNESVGGGAASVDNK